MADEQREREMLALIQERDRLEVMCDDLAAAIAPADVLGEHSSGNDPWRNALDYADTATQRRDNAFPTDADSATRGEVERLAERLQQADPDGPYSALLDEPLEWDNDHTDRGYYRAFAAALVGAQPATGNPYRVQHAASSGVQGAGEVQRTAEERLAAVLAACDNLAERAELHQAEGKPGKWRKRLSETLRVRGETQRDAVAEIRRAAGAS